MFTLEMKLQGLMQVYYLMHASVSDVDILLKCTEEIIFQTLLSFYLFLALKSHQCLLGYEMEIYSFLHGWQGT